MQHVRTIGGIVDGVYELGRLVIGNSGRLTIYHHP